MNFNLLKASFILLLAMENIQFQAPQYPLKEDVATIAGLMKATYEAVSGEKRQWASDRSLHHPSAVYFFPHKVNGQWVQATMSLKDFHKTTDQMAAKTAFYEK